MIDINITFFIQCINFLVSLFLINILIVAPIRSVMAKRKAEMEHLAKEVNTFTEQIDVLLQSYETTIAQVTKTAQENTKTIVEKAKAESTLNLSKAKEKALTITTSAEEEFSKQRILVLQELAPSISSFSQTITKRLVQ